MPARGIPLKSEMLSVDVTAIPEPNTKCQGSKRYVDHHSNAQGQEQLSDGISTAPCSSLQLTIAVRLARQLGPRATQHMLPRDRVIWVWKPQSQSHRCQRSFQGGWRQ